MTDKATTSNATSWRRDDAGTTNGDDESSNDELHDEPATLPAAT
jgi:hypothetical protein